jgi:hypothetical protein
MILRVSPTKLLGVHFRPVSPIQIDISQEVGETLQLALYAETAMCVPKTVIKDEPDDAEFVLNTALETNLS